MTQSSTTSTHVRLEEFIEKPQYGLTASAVAKSVGPKFLRITDIQDGFVDWNSVPFCGAEARDLRSELFLEPDDIVVARIGATTGKAFLIETCPKAVFASYLMRIRTKNGLLPKFLYYFFQGQSYWRQIEQNKGGKLKGGINIPILQNLHVYRPPQAQQAATVTVLDAIQTARNLRKKELELERERKAALMERLFTHGTHGEPLKETEIGSIPKSWDVQSLEEIAQVVYGAQAAVAHNTDRAIGTPILTNINISNEGKLDLSTLRYYAVPPHRRDRLILQKGDVLFNWRSGSAHHVGKSAVFEEDGEYTFASFILRFRVTAKISNHFLLYYLHNLRRRGYFTQMRSQSSINSVFNASVASKMTVIFPSLEEQNIITGVLRACDSKIDTLTKELGLIDELFQAILEELMTGRLSVEKLVEEAA